jgi:hypothetical protein
MVLEEIRDSTLPGKREEENRAGITPKILRGTRDHTIKTAMINLEKRKAGRP